MCYVLCIFKVPRDRMRDACQVDFENNNAVMAQDGAGPCAKASHGPHAAPQAGYLTLLGGARPRAPFNSVKPNIYEYKRAAG